MALRQVLTPVKIGPIEVPNRVVRTGHGTEIGRFTMSEDLIAYHLAAAKGGVGLSTVEWLAVDQETSPGHLTMNDAGLQEGYRRLMAAVRPYGMRVIQQLNHAGHNANRPGLPPWSSSWHPGVNGGIRSMPMSKDQIEYIVHCFADAAAFAEEGGLDGVEIHGAHGYLIQQFFSPLHNERTDEYGGPLENRTRFMLEVARAIRARVSSSFVVGIRLSPELMKGGNTSEDCTYAVQRLEDENLIDVVNLSVGNYYTLHKTVGPMNEPMGYELPITVPVANATRVPRIVIGRFRTLEEADQVISRGEADLVGMTRAHIADPAIVRKTREGRADQIRPCIGCNQGCTQGFIEGHFGCTVNVAAGEELSLSEELIERVSTPKRIMVVGGGPAGLEAARVAALRGHMVTLAEARPNLGGAIRVAARAPRRQGIGDITDWLEREIYRLGVEVRLSTYVTADDVRAERPDAVIVATGSRSIKNGFQLFAPDDVPSGIELPHVVSSEEVIVGGAQPVNGVAVVFDDTGHYEGIATVEYLLEKGHLVTMVTGHRSFAPKLYGTFSEDPALERFGHTGRFRLLTRYKLIAIEATNVMVAPLYAPQQVEEIPATLLALVGINAPNDQIAEELADYSHPVITVGDAKSPRFLKIAIREGHLAARNL
jgi:2,4-dienoyl-CoA reductase-like NADH-dependent reductase (Old Yellow Enzyme family)